MLKLPHKPLGLLIGVAGGTAAGAIVTRGWTLVTGQGDPPQAPPIPTTAGGRSASPLVSRAPSSEWSKPGSTEAEPSDSAH